MGILSSSKRILITGASQGIGRATALALARQGHRVVLAARNQAALMAVAQEISSAGGHAEVLPLDLTNDASVATAIRTLLQGGPCDVLVNNAGICEQADFLVLPIEAMRAEMELNYWGALRVTRALLPTMVQRGTGVIVNVSSLLGIIASPTTANYSASKAALNAWSHALRGEVGRFGLKVVVFVAPHTDTATGRRVKFHKVVSLPVSYTVKELLRAIDNAPRQYAASPAYRFLLRLNGLFPKFMENQVATSAKPMLWADYRGLKPPVAKSIDAAERSSPSHN